MPYIGRDIRTGAFRQLDDISSGFDGSDTTHTMQVNSTNVSVGDVNQIILSLGGVIQKPGTDFTVSGSTLTFTTAPAANTSFFAILLGSDNGGTVTPTDGSVTGDKVASTGAFTIGAAGTTSSIAGANILVEANSLFIGDDVSSTTDTAANSVAVGIDALDAVTTGDANVAVGKSALSAVNTGADNIGIGNQAGAALTTGTANIAIGSNALATEDAGTKSIAIGANALNAQNVSGSVHNIAIGNDAGKLITTGLYNIMIGGQAGDGFDTESENVGIGTSALGGSIAGGEYNVAVGNNTLDALTSGDNNVAIGYNAGTTMTSTTGNTLIGYEAGRAQNYDGAAYVTMVGYQAGEDQTTSAYNTGFGAFNQKSSDTETHNTSIGYYAMNGANGGGEYNTALGSYVMSDASQSGDYNVGAGWRALYANTTGSNNVALGYKAGTAVNTGYQNTIIGSQAGDALTSGDDNVIIGYNAAAGHTGGDFQTIVGSGCAASGTSHQIVMGYNNGSAGNNYVTLGTGSGGDKIYAQYTSSATWTKASDERIKKDITTNTDCGLDFINELRTVKFKKKNHSEVDKNLTIYDASDTEPRDDILYGLIAQEVKAAMEKHNVNDFDGWHKLSKEASPDEIQGVSEQMFVYPLIKAVQELSAKVKALEEA